MKRNGHIKNGHKKNGHENIHTIEVCKILFPFILCPAAKNERGKTRQGSSLGTPPPRRFNAPAVGNTSKNQRADIPEGCSALWVGSSPFRTIKG